MLRFFGNLTLEYTHGSDTKKYKIDEFAFIAAYETASGKGIDNLPEHFIECDFNGLTPEGMWKADNNIDSKAATINTYNITDASLAEE